MSTQLVTPTTDDRTIWDIWTSVYWLPALMVADEIGLFEAICDEPATARELARRLDLNLRGVEALLPLLATLGLLVPRLGRYHLTDTARNFLLPKSPFYWGGVFVRSRQLNSIFSILRDRLTLKNELARNAEEAAHPADFWQSGQLTLEQAWPIARFMHSHSAPAAVGLARNGDFEGVRRLLDVGGGSGCFAIALAQKHPTLRCTILELPAMCSIAQEYIAASGVSDRVDACAVDMFRQAWPRGYDAIFFSNIFHDWSLETCAELSKKALEALPEKGRIYLHEMLLNEDGSGGRTPAGFSVMMLIGTRGRQYTFGELNGVLQDVGFVDIAVRATYGYFSLISGRKA
jgi:acetylserotonin N-methyltransferase